MHYLATIMTGVLLAVSGAHPAFAWNLTIINNNNAPVDQPLRLVSANPYDNQMLEESPQEVLLKFTQGIRPDKSYIRVLNNYGARVDEAELESTGTHLSLPLPKLPPGKYTLKWRARCQCAADTEISDVFHFTVR